MISSLNELQLFTGLVHTIITECLILLSYMRSCQHTLLNDLQSVLKIIIILQKLTVHKSSIATICRKIVAEVTSLS